MSFMPRTACMVFWLIAARAGSDCLPHRNYPVLFTVGAAQQAPCAVVRLHVLFDQLLEILGDRIALERHSLLTIDVHRRHRPFARSGATDANIGLPGFAGPID